MLANFVRTPDDPDFVGISEPRRLFVALVDLEAGRPGSRSTTPLTVARLPRLIYVPLVPPRIQCPGFMPACVHISFNRERRGLCYLQFLSSDSVLGQG